MSLIIPANSAAASGGYQVDNSVRFDGSSSFSISQGNTNRRTFTISAWVKRSDISGGAGIVLLNSYSSSSDYTSISLNNDGRLNVNSYLGGYPGGDDQCYIASNALYRDVGAWYHFCVGIDTTNGTTSERQKLWVNGERLTSFQSSSNLFSQNAQTKINSGATAYIQKNQYGAAQKSSYMSEVCFIDGQQLDADQFGEFDENSGIFKPIDVSGLTFGTNGFYLEFKQSGTSQNSSGLGADTSGEDNHLAVSNLTAIDQSLDSCTNNFATLNPLNVPASNQPTFSEGNLQSISKDGAGSFGGSSTFVVSSGKWYLECKALNATSSVGITFNQGETARTNNDGTEASYEWNYKYNGTLGHGTDSSYGDSFTTNDIVGILLNLDDNELKFSKNGTLQNSGTAISITANQEYAIYHQDDTESGSNRSNFAFNFGSPPYAISSGNQDPNGYGNFEYSTNGYYALNTKNLSEFG